MKLRNVKSFIIFILTPMLLITACGHQGALFSILPTGQSFQGSVQSNKVDILWIVDNSGSMLTKQQNLAASFGSFINTFAAKNYDFHMAILTSDFRAAPLGQDSIFQGTPKVITNATPAFTTVFQTNVVVGALGDAAAKILDVTGSALSAGNLAGANTGFIRPDAFLAVISVSDADDDDSVATTTQIYNALKALKPDVVDASTGRSKAMFSWNAVMDDWTNPGPVPCVGSEDGVKFRTLATQTGGSRMDICAANFSAGLTNLSQNIASFISQVLLKQEPQVDTIDVIINGSLIPFGAANGWTYESTGNKIVFHGTAIPDNNATIYVTYIPTDIVR